MFRESCVQQLIENRGSPTASKHDHQSFWFLTKTEVMVGLRRLTAKTPGPEGEPAGIQARNCREGGFNKEKGDLLSTRKDRVLYLSLFPFIK